MSLSHPLFPLNPQTPRLCLLPVDDLPHDCALAADFLVLLDPGGEGMRQGQVQPATRDRPS